MLRLTILVYDISMLMLLIRFIVFTMLMLSIRFISAYAAVIRSWTWCLCCLVKNLNITIKTSTLDLQERERSEFLLTVLYLDYEDLYCYCNWVCFHSDDRLFSYRILDGCELRLVTDSRMRLAYARAMRARLGLRLALGRCRASNSIQTPQQLQPQ